MELRHIRYAVVLAEEGTFGLAAKRLHVSQPNLSVQIKNLERLVGHALFERSPSGVRLTLAGQAFLTEARETLISSQRAVAAARGHRLVRVGCSPLPWNTWELADTMTMVSQGTFQAKVATCSPDGGIPQLISGDIDVSIGYDSQQVSDEVGQGVKRILLVREPAWVALNTRFPPSLGKTLGDFARSIWLVPHGQLDLERFTIATCRDLAFFEPRIQGVAGEEVLPALKRFDAVMICSPLVPNRHGLHTIDLNLTVRRNLYLAWRGSDNHLTATIAIIGQAFFSLYRLHARGLPGYARWISTPTRQPKP